MKTTCLNMRSCIAVVIGMAVFSLLTFDADSAYANRDHKGGVQAAKHVGENPPGPAGGQGAGPRWKDNPYKVDNPPGKVGGKGTDWNYGQYRRQSGGNPPGSVGGQGAGPRWTDNPYRIDNPPGPYGGRGTDWKKRPFKRGPYQEGAREEGEDPVDNSVESADDVSGDTSAAEEGNEMPEGQHYGRGRLQHKLNQLIAKRDRINQQIARIEQWVNQQHVTQ